MNRRFRYVVYRGLGGSGDAAGEEVLGEWIDSQAPTFRHGFNGAGELRLTLPRWLGRRDDGSEGGDDTLSHGARVDVWVADDWSLRSDSAGGRLVYRGVLEEIVGLAGLEVTVLPLSYVYDHQYFAASATYSNLDPLEIARTLVISYGGAVPWDETNPLGTGVTLASVTFEKSYLMAALRACATAAGLTWHAFVSPRGKVRFVDDIAAGAQVHHLTHGMDCAADLDSLTQSTMERARRIFLFYTDPAGTKRSTTAVSNDFNSDFPRDLITTWNERISQDIAEAIADAMLVELDRVRLSLSVRVDVNDYDIDAIDIGDHVQLRIPRPLPLAEVAQKEGGYAEINVRIAEIDYQGHAVVLSLDTPGVSMTRLVAKAQDDLRALAMNALGPS